MGTDDLAEHEEVLSNGRGIEEMESTMVVLTTVDLDIAHSSEKLANLHVLLMLLLGWDYDPASMGLENGEISATFIEKALGFDLLSGILDSELREVESFMDSLQVDIVDARERINLCRHLREPFVAMEEKLRGSEESLRRCQERVLEVKMHSIKLQRSISYFRPVNCRNGMAMGVSENYLPSNIFGKLTVQTAEQRRHVLRMLEKSLARELDLEKKLSEMGRSEEQLKLKLHHTEQVTSRMEEAAEVVYGRFLEAENASEVLMEISKGMLGRLQLAHFNLNGSGHREAELKSKLERCNGELNTKDLALKNLESSKSEQDVIVSEVLDLREKVKLLEEKLNQSEQQLKNASESNEASQNQLNGMGSAFEALKEHMYEAESKAESAEAKVTELTDTNLELNEELNLLRGNNDNNTKKVASLEKQLRETEIQLQHAKVSSEASQEQQNMLYSAIWDMETLIEDLKSKVSKAESRTDEVEEQCIELSESNFSLNEEISILREKVKSVETSLDQANDAKEASAKEINHGTKVIMDMVLKLASERERIQKQLFLQAKENEILIEKLKSFGENHSSTTMGYADKKEMLLSKDDSTRSPFNTKTCNEVVSASTIVQAGG